MSRIAACATLLAAAATLAACGKAGQLERPGPMFGQPRVAAPADNEQRDPTRPMTTIDPRDRNLGTQPSRTDPIGGQSPDPLGDSPRGSLPDPYANPQ